jgi:prepilin-type N-terminal cleavage/methylation domain-containing protein
MSIPPKRKRLSSAGGFTLIELMIVVAIIGILAAIAIPKFANMIQKSKEGTTKGKLGALRGALEIYYSQMEGYYPSDLTPFTAPGNPFVTTMPLVYTASHGTSDVIDYPSNYDTALDEGGWGYVGSGTDLGKVWVECTHTDVVGSPWYSY